MSTIRQEGRPPATPLAHRVGVNASAAEIATAVFTAWEEVDDILTPIIGALGVVALYKRSLHLTTAVHPQLAGGQAGGQPVALRSLLANQSAADAAAIGNTFLHAFHDLLTSLVGPSLTERLLRTVWTPAKDTSP